jgi:hypothetical protein
VVLVPGGTWSLSSITVTSWSCAAWRSKWQSSRCQDNVKLYCRQSGPQLQVALPVELPV